MGRKLSCVSLEIRMWLGSLRRVFRSLRFFILLLTLFIDLLLAPRPLTLRQHWFLGRPPGDYFTRSLSIYICCKLKSNSGHTNTPFNNFHCPQYVLSLEQRDLLPAYIEYVAGIFKRQNIMKKELWAAGVRERRMLTIWSVHTYTEPLTVAATSKTCTVDPPLNRPPFSVPWIYRKIFWGPTFSLRTGPVR